LLTHLEVVIPCLHLLEKVKRQHGKAWNVFENATEVFHCLSSPCDNLTQSEIDLLICSIRAALEGGMPL
jgi:Leucine-rich repeat (LRR) protein